MAEKFFKSKGPKYVSPLTIVELSSVYSRILDKIKLSKIEGEEEDMDDAQKLEVVVQTSLIDCGLSHLAVPLSAEWTFGNQRMTVPLEYAEARNTAASIRLRTMDLLHLSYVSLLLKTGTVISQFVTGDEELLSKRDIIRELIGIHVVRPEEGTLVDTSK